MGIIKLGWTWVYNPKENGYQFFYNHKEERIERLQMNDTNYH